MEDIDGLLSQAKLRFSHANAKAHLKEKYTARLLVASQGGLFKATPELMSFLSVMTDEELVLLDNYDNPTKVNRVELLELLSNTYNTVMVDWLNEDTDIKNRR